MAIWWQMQPGAIGSGDNAVSSEGKDGIELWSGTRLDKSGPCCSLQYIAALRAARFPEETWERATESLDLYVGTYNWKKQ